MSSRRRMTSFDKESTLVVAFCCNTHNPVKKLRLYVMYVDVVVAMYEVVWDLSLLLSEAEVVVGSYHHDHDNHHHYCYHLPHHHDHQSRI